MVGWTVPGDDGLSGDAYGYDIRYSKVAITSSSWNSASLLNGEPAPSTSGTRQTFTLNGIIPNTTYHFALKTSDEVLNWSAISNIATIKTQKITGIIGEWDFDEISGTTTYDTSGNNNHGSLVNMDTSTCRINGKLGMALRFDGVDDFVELKSNNELNFDASNDFSIIGWINIDPSVTSESLGIFATNLEWDSGKVLSFKYKAGNNAFYLTYNYGGGAGYDSLQSSNKDIETGAWHQAAITKTGNVGYFYCDGTPLGSDNTNFLSTMNSTNGTYKRIGRSNASLDPFKGMIDDLKVYDRALSAEEILAAYQAGMDTTVPQLTVISPVNGDVFLTPTISVIGTASDTIGISKVELKVGAGPWQLADGTTTWSKALTLDYGLNTITVRATDRAWNTTTATLSVKFSPVPLSISFTKPKDGAKVLGIVEIEVAVTSDYTINKIEFYLNDILINTDNELPYTWNWNTKDVPGSNYKIKAVAYDEKANISEKEITVKVIKVEKEVIYPNPYVKGKSASEKINFGNLPKESVLRIYTVSGELIQTIRHEQSADGGSEEWNISDISSGIYIYTIISAKGTTKGKLSIIK